MNARTPEQTSSTASPHVGANQARKKVELLQSFLKLSIEDIGKKRKLNQRRATWAKLLILCMSGGATILLGIDISAAVEVPLKNAAFALTSLVTLLNALEPFFNYRGLWIEHERANAAFFAVKDRLAFYVTGRADAELELEVINGFYGEYEQVWANLNDAWQHKRQQYQDERKS